MALALAGVEVDLGNRTGLQSRLLVLETHRAKGLRERARDGKN